MEFVVNNIIYYKSYKLFVPRLKIPYNAGTQNTTGILCFPFNLPQRLSFFRSNIYVNGAFV